MRSKPWVLAAAVFPMALASLPAVADLSLVPGTINMFRDNRGANDVGVGAGDILQYGADIAGGSAGASLRAVAATGFVDPAQTCNPLSVNVNFCSNGTGYNATRLDPWTFTFTRGADTLTTLGPSVTGAAGAPIAFPTSVTLSGTGLTPTISWVVQPGFTPDGFRVQIFDKSRTVPGTSQADIIYSTSIAAGSTSFTLPAGIGLSSTGNYAINFQIVETRGHVSFTNNNSQILSRSNSYFDFSPLTGSVPHDIALPTIDASGVYNFHVGGVGPDHITFIDPLVAVGYHYLTGAGNPNFQSVLLPDVGDGLYALTFVDGLGSHTVSLAHDLQYFFGAGGVSDFTVSGIETSAGLDPSNPTAFITGLTFAATGDFTGTMTPLTALVVAVPEPETYALLIAGMALIGVARRRRR
ncbi:MAG: PEP-CTERM sorting domain-containing protein [Caldimonas sp.]